MSVNIFQKATGNLIQIAGNALVIGGDSVPVSSQIIIRNKADFPIEGDKNCIYVSSDENVLYRWDISLSTYVQLDDTANITKLTSTI